ncbi:hypothetical protein AB6E22_13020 [Vibrio cyclitrophicus]|uniref:hypothetical protein n=1 Tax=Vibrio cyclitrophicus TaxID=47951 RepID=UPI0002EFEAB7|nr:hypothetical protein [Vibrio cyclitrophicus]OCH54895.1 hypothetical protein A6D96_07375 [Vibrio cyclitrophicus]
MKTIAISEKASFWKVPDVRASLLAFDHIYIPQGKDIIDRKLLSSDLRHCDLTMENVEFLEQQGIVVKSPMCTSSVVDQAEKILNELKIKMGHENVDSKTAFMNILERLSIRELSKEPSTLFVPSSRLYHSSPLNNANTKSNLYSLIVENLPIISEEVPLDELLDFKREYGSDYQRLLLWVSKIEENDAPTHKDELQHMINSFREHQNIGDLKFRPGKVEMLFQTAGTFMNSFLGKYITVANSLAKVRKENAELLEHEKNNPNRPLSFVVKAMDEFKE